MSSPRYDQLVQVQAPRSERDSLGQPVPGWVDVGEPVWADVRYLNGMQTLKAAAPTSTVKASIRVRWRDDVKADMRVHHEGVAFRISAVLPDLRGREHVDLVCEVINGK